MVRSFVLALAVAVAYVAFAADKEPSGMQSEVVPSVQQGAEPSAQSDVQVFALSGRIAGLQEGDTLRFERVIQPGRADREAAFDIVVEHPDTFSYKGRQEHEQIYRMTFHPKKGTSKVGSKRALTVIITDGAMIKLSGSVGKIYFSRLSGGIYDEPMLAESLRLEDSIGKIRDDYMRELLAAQEEKDTARAEEWFHKINAFGRAKSNPGIVRLRDARKAYVDANPAGTLSLLVDALEHIASTPVEQSRAKYDSWNRELKDSYYGRVFARELADMERLADGQPVPEFALTTVDGKKITEKDFKGRYLLIYHWGLCPGSVFIDQYVLKLHDIYNSRGLEVLGLTESIDMVRQNYERLPADRKVPSGGVDDIRPVLERMLRHPWIEVEVEDCPDNKPVMDAFRITGWPFFALIGPDGKIRARGFSDAFDKSRKVLESELGPSGL